MKWEGYTEETWEAEDQLNCPDLIAKFEKTAKGSKRKSPDGNGKEEDKRELKVPKIVAQFEKTIEDNKKSVKSSKTGMLVCLSSLPYCYSRYYNYIICK